jgi:hypothetical protein
MAAQGRQDEDVASVALSDADAEEPEQEVDLIILMGWTGMIEAGGACEGLGQPPVGDRRPQLLN